MIKDRFSAGPAICMLHSPNRVKPVALVRRHVAGHHATCARAEHSD